MSNVTELFDYMNERGLQIGGMTLGPKATPEAVAEEILKSLKELEAGNYEIIDDIGF